MKSSLTARRVHPWNVKRGRKPDAITKLLAPSASYMKTFSHGTSTRSSTRIESFSSKREDSG